MKQEIRSLSLFILFNLTFCISINKGTQETVRVKVVPSLEEFKKENSELQFITTEVKKSIDKSATHGNSSNACECLKNFSCPKCNSYNPFDFNQKLLSCPCAKIKCKACLPLSKLHDLSIKKAIKDKKTTEKVAEMSVDMQRALKVMIQHIDSVIKYENESKSLAEKLEEAKLKSMIALQRMKKHTESAKQMAKSTFEEDIGGPALGLINYDSQDKEINSILQEEENNEGISKSDIEGGVILNNKDDFLPAKTIGEITENGSESNRFVPQEIDSIEKLISSNSKVQSFSLNYK